MAVDNTRPGLIQKVVMEAIRSALLGTHTALPARIDAYDAATQTATVTPELLREVDDELGVAVPEAIPPIENVPVMFHRAGGFSITFPVAVGDKCMVLFLERDASGWLQAGAPVVPQDSRRHSYSDAVVVLGLWPASDPIDPAPSATALQIRKDDGTMVIHMEPDALSVFSSGAISITSSGSFTINRSANELLEVLSVALDLIATSLVGGVPLSNAAAITAQKVLVDAIRA